MAKDKGDDRQTDRDRIEKERQKDADRAEKERPKYRNA